MKAIRDYGLKAVPKLAALRLIPVVLILAVVGFMLARWFLSTQNQLANLTAISGQVVLSDGITDIAARTGPIVARKERTLLKTKQGIASLKLGNASYLIMDSATIIEFNRQNENNPGSPFAFKLIKGRILVINEKGSQKPIQLFLGGDTAVRVFHSAAGLEFWSEEGARGSIDCLVGQCLVNGIHLVKSGQNAQIGPGNAVLVTDGVSVDKWLSLENASSLNPSLSSLFSSIFATFTETIIPTPSPQMTKQPPIPITGKSTLTESPMATLTLRPTATPTSNIIIWLPSLTNTASYPKRPPTPTSTRTLTSPYIPPSTSTPSRTPTPTYPFILPNTSTPSNTLTPGPPASPTGTPIPQPTITNTPQPTPTSQPTITPQPTIPPTLTSIPSRTPRPTRTPKVTPTLAPTATATFTDIPLPSDTPLPPPLPTDTPIPADTQVPTDSFTATVEIIIPIEQPASVLPP